MNSNVKLQEENKDSNHCVDCGKSSGPIKVKIHWICEDCKIGEHQEKG